MVQLNIENLSLTLSDTPVVKAVSFEAKAGEFVALIGPNGAGKTTIIKAIAGLARYSGIIHIDKQEVKTMPAVMRGQILSYIPQGHDVHWPMCVKDIVRLGRLPFGAVSSLEDPDDEAIVLKALQLTDLEEFSERRFDQLSGGEKSRVMIARALATKASILLADEPTAALDPYNQLYMLELLKSQVKQGKCVIAVLHDITLAAQFADKIILLDNGKVVSCGPAANVLTLENMRNVYQVEVAQSINLGLGVWKRILQ